MTPSHSVRAEFATPASQSARKFIRWVCTNNPFYVISAGLFMIGLRMSFPAQARDIDTWALMAGLTGYTLLLATTAFLLVRFAKVWDDVRTLLLLVVLMFLAISVTFDEVLALDPDRGQLCYLMGLFFAVVVTEGVLHGIRLRLPVGFRIPYYLILSLFFLYPPALSPLLHEPRSEELMWGLFGFSPLAGLVFLTLLPAIRRGPEYMRDNGSPWPWPLYPWTLFGVLAFAVPSRTFLMCWSMHLLEGGSCDQLIFGPYFLAPFGLSVAILLLEIGIVARHRGAQAIAMLIPGVLIFLTTTSHSSDPIYQNFLGAFADRLGGMPLYLTLLASAMFYCFAALRRAPLAVEGLTATSIVLAGVGPLALDLSSFSLTHPLPLFAAAIVQLALGLEGRTSWRCALGAMLVSVGVTMTFPESPLRSIIAFHLVMLAVLSVGAIFDDAFARFLRAVGVALGLMASAAVLYGVVGASVFVPSQALVTYPLAMSLLLAGYGLLLGYRPSLTVAGVVGASWLMTITWRLYGTLRLVIIGLDYLGLSLIVFALAVLISLGKSGMLPRWRQDAGNRDPQGDAGTTVEPSLE